MKHRHYQIVFFKHYQFEMIWIFCRNVVPKDAVIKTFSDQKQLVLYLHFLAIHKKQIL